MSTSFEADFADGRYKFSLSMEQIVALERGPKRHRHDREYPKSIFRIYDQLKAGFSLCSGVAGFTGAGYVPMSDMLHVIQQALIGGGSGRVNGKPVDVCSRRAAQLIEAHSWPSRPSAETQLLALSILHAAIHGCKRGLAA